MLTIGLTGGIGSGKTTVASMFEARGVPIIDTDCISREITTKNNAGYRAVIAEFGNVILDNNHAIDRNKLRSIVFSDNKKRKKLESLLHPLIRQEVNERVSKLSAHPYCIIVVPLLFEAGFEDIVNRVLVVDSPEQTQVERVANRDNISVNEVRDIMQAQLSRETRLGQAHDVITNDGDLTQLSDRVEKLHQQYIRLAQDSA